MPLIRSDASQIVYRRPLGMRIFKGVLSLFFGVLVIGLLLGLWPDGQSFQNRLPAEVLGRLASLLLIALMIFGLAGYLFYSAGPVDLDLDLTAHTYRFRRGFPFLAHWVSGPFDDIACVYVIAVQSRAFTTYQTVLGWKNYGDAAREDVALASHGSLEATQAQARAMAWDMGVPVEEDLEAERSARSRRQSQQRSRLLLMLSSCCLGGMCLALSLPRLYVTHALNSQGQTTLATVVGRQIGQSGRIHYLYRVHGKTYRGADYVTASDYKTLPVGAPVQVTYLPSYPLTSRIARSNTAYHAYFTLFMGLGILLIGLLRLLLSPHPRPLLEPSEKQRRGDEGCRGTRE
ncbi:MAG TPA: DUF3592 domain-containing protein [Chthonomonadaceae bacterium]|nr:DUF3592 domain-containing protein [Chthonomonadaceae bacterium]